MDKEAVDRILFLKKKFLRIYELFECIEDPTKINDDLKNYERAWLRSQLDYLVKNNMKIFDLPEQSLKIISEKVANLKD